MPSTHSLQFSSTQIEALRRRIKGRVLVRGDDGYDLARQTWNANTFEQHPALVVLPSSATDVAAAVSFAREHDLLIAAQSGGHGHPRPANDALLVNFASMKAVQVTDAGTVRVDAGATWGDVVAAAHPQGLAPLNGFAGTVGVAGYTLGGGTGWLVRQYGAAAGSLQNAEVVTADGRQLRVDAGHHNDLFWGLRGGGGNFGIVTAFEFALYPIKEIFGGFVAYPWSLGKDALNAYANWANTAPEALTSAVRLVHFPPAPLIPEPLRGASAVVIMACYSGSASAGEKLVKPLRSIGAPLVDTFRAMPYAEIGTIASDPPQAPQLFTTGNGRGMRELSPEAIDAMLHIAGDRTSGLFVVELRHCGGALARQPQGAMAFEFRSPWFVAALAAAPALEALERGKRSIAALLDRMKPVLTGEVLINTVDAHHASPEVTRAAYSAENYSRLVALKDQYDATNVFRFNHNIAPSNTADREVRVGQHRT
jgi:FAD/FMN-containing dehydrogenase